MPDSNRLRRLQQKPLWDFALAFYARPGVESACLTLQERAGVDVCELLLHGWLYWHGLMADGQALASHRPERAAWQHDITAPLRTLRRKLKPEARANPSVAALRERIKQAELAAEQENIHGWQVWAEAVVVSHHDVLDSGKSLQDLADLLQKSTFCDDIDSAVSSDSRACKASETAWLTLAGQLDRFEWPR